MISRRDMLAAGASAGAGLALAGAAQATPVLYDKVTYNPVRVTDEGPVTVPFELSGGRVVFTADNAGQGAFRFSLSPVGAVDEAAVQRLGRIYNDPRALGFGGGGFGMSNGQGRGGGLSGFAPRPHFEGIAGRRPTRRFIVDLRLGGLAAPVGVICGTTQRWAADLDGAAPSGAFLWAREGAFDFESRRFLVAPKGLEYLSAGGDPLSPMRNYMTYPDVLRVGAELDGEHLNLRVDFSRPEVLLLNAAATKRLKAFRGRTVEALAADPAGIFPVLEARASNLLLGGVAIERPMVTGVRPDQEGGAADGEDGVIGVEALRRTLLFKTRKGDVFLKANRFAADPVRYDRSGLRLHPAVDRQVVERVTPGSPAEKSGVQAGDVVSGLQDPLARAAFEDRLRGVAGELVAFDVMRDGKAVPMRLELAELL
jgi:hypothetical protein